MLNCEKTLALQLSVKFQDQLLASQLVPNALLDEFSNIDNIYESCRPTILSAVQLLKTNSKNTSPPENLGSKRSLLSFSGDALKWLTGTDTMKEIGNQTIYKPNNTGADQTTGDLIDVISNLNFTGYTAQVNAQKLYDNR